MSGKELTRAESGSRPLGTRERSIVNVLLIFFVNLLGFWLILPGSLLLLGSLLDNALSFTPFRITPALFWYPIAAVMLVSGLSLSLYSILLFAYFGDGMPIASLPPRRFVDKGTYVFSRHPIYVGYSIALLGAGLLFRSLSFLLIVLPVFVLCWILFALLYEERVLGKRYGETYLQYKKSTPLLFSVRSFLDRRGEVEHPIMYMLTGVVFKVINRLYFDVEISGNPEPQIERPFVMVANHANYLDPFIINACIKEYARISTTESAFRNTIVRGYLSVVGAFPLARYRPMALNSIRQSLRILKAGESLAIFPEAERSWDGSPLEIDDTVVRFLQKAGRPIFAVNVSGNYNAFPRWAKRPRRGKIRIHFHPPFSLAGNRSVEENKRILTEKLHSPGKSCDEATWIKGKTLAEGLPMLLWRCPLCRTNDGLFVERGIYVRCRACASRWELKPNCQLNLLINGFDRRQYGEKELAKWYALIKDLEDIAPVPLTCGFLPKGEAGYLESGTATYSSYRRFRKCFSFRGNLVLTDRRLIFFNDEHLICDELPEIRKIVIEGNDRLELGFLDKMISIRFKDESPLKWQTYIERVRTVAGAPD